VLYRLVFLRRLSLGQDFLRRRCPLGVGWVYSSLVDLPVLRAFSLELQKLAVRVPVAHGTNSRWEVLRPGVGETIASRDPNPRAVYVGTSTRGLRGGGLAAFARQAVRKRGGEAVLALARIDTEKGWRPRGLTEWGRKNIGSLEDAEDLVAQLDEGLRGAERARAWKAISRGVGAWVNEDLATVLRPIRYTRKLAYVLGSGSTCAPSEWNATRP